MPPRKAVVKRKVTSDDEYDDSRDGAGDAYATGASDSDEDCAPGPSAAKRTTSKKKGAKRKRGATDMSDDSEDDFAPPKKSKTKSETASKTKAKARKPKKLELFQSMPLDVLALIMSALDTKTLLAMSRTCSAFRSLLHPSQGTSVWKAARYNTARIPDLTAGDLEEWMYASLLFDRTCHVCQKARADTVDYVLRARACASCMRSNSKQQSKISRGYHSQVWDCAPESRWSPGFETYTFFWVPTVASVSRRLYELKGKDGFDAFVAERKRIKQAAIVDGQQLRNWDVRFRASKITFEWDVKTSRRKKIDAKLKDLGYTANEIHYSNVRKHSLYNQPRDLTDRIWTTIEPKLVAQLEGHRDTVRKREEAKAMKARGEALRPYYDGMHTALGAEARSLFPPFGNWLHLESVKPLYEPEDAKPDDVSFQAIRAAIKAECDKFASQIQTVFWSRLVKAHSQADEQEVPKVMPVSQLKALAQRITSAINCPNECCSTFATFPSILDHFKVCTLSALTDTSLYTSAAHVKAIRHVVAAVDAVEPQRALAKSATCAALYALGDAFRCVPCQPQQSAVGPAVWSRALSLDMNWSATVLHIVARHRNSPDLPSLLYTPPQPASDGVDNPGGFIVDESEDQ
ncbi:F-box protein [Rhodotorula paludigena]|uniref:F-box protein n=1 Tax=Rhodotorula paludigena TaxID=86838 RepID=UPI003179D59B